MGGWYPGKYLKKAFKSVKGAVKKIGRGIKKVAKGLAKAFGKLGVLGQIGLMFIPGVGQVLSGMLGTLGKGAATFITNTFGAVGTAAVNGFKAIMGGIKAASGAMKNVYSSITDAVMGGVDWITKTVSGGKFNTFGDAFDGFKSWVQDTGNKIFGTEPTTTKPDFLLDNLDESRVTEITHGSGDSILSKTKTYSAADQNILDTVSQYKEKGLSNLADDALKNLSPEGKAMYDSSITVTPPKSDFLLDNLDESRVTQITHGGDDVVKKVAEESNNVFDDIVSLGVDEVKSGITQGLKDKGRELVTGKPPVPNYITNNTPDWLSTMSMGGFNSDLVAQTDFALQQRGGLYGATGGTISSFGQEFIANYGKNDPYTTVMRSLMK